MDALARRTIETMRRYDRMAPFYDLTIGPVERWAFGRWRQRLWEGIDGGRVLEVGVGTGANFHHYPRGVSVTAIDVSTGMLARAREKVRLDGLAVGLQVMDIQRLAFADDSFDAVLGSLVFCSVPDPVVGLREIRRVARPGCRVRLLEHVRTQFPLLGRAKDIMNPLWRRLTGDNFNRRTLDNVVRSGLRLERATSLLFDIVLLIEASVIK